jgi:hypothetical protein
VPRPRAASTTPRMLPHHHTIATAGNRNRPPTRQNLVRH